MFLKYLMFLCLRLWVGVGVFIIPIITYKYIVVYLIHINYYRIFTLNSKKIYVGSVLNSIKDILVKELKFLILLSKTMVLDLSTLFAKLAYI